MNKIKHVAIIMDGNGRWATAKNKSRTFGHLEGIKRIPEIVEEAQANNIDVISLFAFSIENWNRPIDEVDFLIKQLIKYASSKKLVNQVKEKNIKLVWTGSKKGLDKKIIDNIEKMQELTKENTGITVNFVFNYGFQYEIEELVKKVVTIDNASTLSTDQLLDFLPTSIFPPVDLLIRTSGEKRISNFLLWSIRYAEIIFEDKLWPEYTVDVFKKNIEEFTQRSRRFGRV